MISPEGFYLRHLKGKSKVELIREIHILKCRLGTLRKSLENPLYKCEVVYPSNVTRLLMNQLYLKRAIQTYEEVGVVYKPSRAEMKAIDFNDNIYAIREIVFTLKNYFRGIETRKLTVDGELIKLSISNTSRDNTLFTKESTEVYEMTKSEVLNEIRFLNIGEWKSYYNSERYGVYVRDGTDWSVAFFYSNDHRPVKYCGSNAYPYNCDGLARLCGIELDEIENEE